MLIDWFTVAAQIANFAILVWLLKRFLYRPVLDAMAAREKRVRETVAAADRQKAAAEEEANRLHEQQDAFAQTKGGSPGKGARRSIRHARRTARASA